VNEHEARHAEREYILSLIDQQFPLWVGKYLRKILSEKKHEHT